MELSLLLEKLLAKVLDYDHFVIGEIWLTGADSNKMSLVAKTSRSLLGEKFHNQTIQFTSFSKGESLPGAVWESGKILEWDHLEDQDNFQRSQAARDAGVKTAYGVPIISENIIIGVLVLGATEKFSEKYQPFTPLFEKLSVHFGVGIKRKQLEDELNQIFSLAPDIICTLGTDRYLKKVNPAMSILLGYSEEELLAKPLDAFLHPDDLEFSKSRMEKFIAGEKTLSFENRFLTKAGNTIWLSWTSHLNEREGLLFCVGKNVSAKKNADDMLQASESNLHAVIENTDAYIYSFDRELRYVTYNKKLSEMMKAIYHVDVTPGFFILDLILEHHPEDLQEWKEVYAKALAGEAIQFEKQIIVGKHHTYNSFSINPIWQNEKVTGLSCFVNDITYRKLTELSLVESEQRYSQLFQLSPLPKMVFDIENLRFLDVNEAALKQYGYTRREFLKISVEKLRIHEENPLTEGALRELKQPTGTTEYYGVTHQKKNGERIIVDALSNPILYKGKKARIGVTRDITETLSHIQAIEAQNEKLREISWLQSHIVRAPLARIMGLISLLDISEGLPDETKKMLGYVLQSANELDAVIHDIVLQTEVINPKEI